MVYHNDCMTDKRKFQEVGDNSTFSSSPAMCIDVANKSYEIDDIFIFSPKL